MKNYGAYERYDNLDGLRSIACLCIIAMHIYANAKYNLGTVGQTIVMSWTQFVSLFLIISGFGMFCGYYINDFYLKRYKKFLPFFVTLIVIDVVMNKSLSHIIEGLTETTLIFGLLPNNQLEVIGVSWTIGVIFLFYMLFPFVVYLCWNKKRACWAFVISIMLSLFCSYYYFTDKFVIENFAERHNFLYCTPFFVGGGIAYLNRKTIKKFVEHVRWLWLTGCICLTILWYCMPEEMFKVDVTMLKNLVLFMSWLMYAISVNSKILSNKVMKYISGISLELYLAQMIVFRILEKVNGLYLLGCGWCGFISSWIMIVAGLIVFIELWKRAWTIVKKQLKIFESVDKN